MVESKLFRLCIYRKWLVFVEKLIYALTLTLARVFVSPRHLLESNETLKSESPLFKDDRTFSNLYIVIYRFDQVAEFQTRADAKTYAKLSRHSVPKNDTLSFIKHYQPN